MITLPNIVLTDADAATPGVGGKAAASSGDFLALLSQALPAGIKGADGKALNLAALTADAATGKTAPQQDLAALVAAGDDATAENPLAALLATVGQDDDALASLGKLIGTVKPGDAKDDAPALESDKKLSSEDMAALSALFAMLPQQTPLAQATTLSTTAGGQNIAAVSASAQRPSLGETLSSRTASAAQPADGKGNAAAAVTPAATAQQLADTQVVQPTGLSEKVQADASPTAGQSPHNLTPLAASIASVNTTTAQVATPVVPHINAQLGTPEWQSSVSQHITLFTRQGQQTAELRLNPENLGSVHISLKIDDNQAQLQMVSPHSHVRSALEAALPVLRTQLAENGIQLGQSSISSESSAGGQQTDQQQQQANRGGGFTFAGADDEVLSVPASLQSAARGNNAVDIFA
ncbi:flagellar hook-length control protein FliK [Siccibacter turicensis]|uniref:Flagellar hook-length control protein FliK n=1 Tax=Siccibacter turicensis TaxID=357233 RepID=A0A2P8VKE3_9ENTR|nr:flagellar hook-length control protein FliK [Siccibacter turicensis]PSN08027.1 flagellar hook-length control protein FliK [Siccibacter turicensis]